VRHRFFHGQGAFRPHTYNILGGFEGDLDVYSRRGRINAWKADGPPWRQT
jgi:hypothetical protein